MTSHKKALVSEYFTVAWNVLEGIIAIAAGIIYGSIALVGFGIDSYIEVASGLILIWRLRKHGFNNEDEEEAAEKKAVFFVGVTFILLPYMWSSNPAKTFFSRTSGRKPDWNHPGRSFFSHHAYSCFIQEEDCSGDQQPRIKSRRLGNPRLFLSFSCAPSWLGGQRSVRLVVG